jgi:hypothetical protein
MGDKYVSNFLIAGIGTVVAILMFIATDSAYMFYAFAQTNATDIGTNRTINIQRTTSSGENVTTDSDDDVVVGNALIMPSRIINNVGVLAIDKFANIFKEESRIIPF